MRAGWLIALVAGTTLAVAIGTCGGSRPGRAAITAGPPPARPLARIRGCLQARHVPATLLPPRGTLLDTITPKATGLLGADAPSAVLIARYVSAAAASDAFARLATNVPAIQHGDLLATFLLEPRPTARLLAKLESCAFGTTAGLAVGARVTASGPRCRLQLTYLGSTSGTQTVFALFRVRNRNLLARRCALNRYPMSCCSVRMGD
jgi:hypothetical protein